MLYEFTNSYNSNELHILNAANYYGNNGQYVENLLSMSQSYSSARNNTASLIMLNQPDETMPSALPVTDSVYMGSSNIHIDIAPAPTNQNQPSCIYRQSNSLL